MRLAAFSPDGQHIFTGSEDKTVRMWNAANGQLVFKLEGDTRYIRHVSVSLDGQRILTASIDGTARVYRLLTLSEIAKILAE